MSADTALSKADTEGRLDHAETRHEKLLVALGFESGARLSELLTIRARGLPSVMRLLRSLSLRILAMNGRFHSSAVFRNCMWNQGTVTRSRSQGDVP